MALKTESSKLPIAKTINSSIESSQSLSVVIVMFNIIFKDVGRCYPIIDAITIEGAYIIIIIISYIHLLTFR